MSNSRGLSTKNSEIKFFYEDVVYRLGKKGNLQLGMVVENSEFASSDEDSSDDEEEKLQKGTIRVAWHPSGDEQVLKETKVGLADRSLMPGDVVRRLIKGKETQRGYCRHVDVHASCVIVGTNQVIYGIKSQDLSPLDKFTPDVAVCLDEWVGMIRHIKSKVTVRFLLPIKLGGKDKYSSKDETRTESICILSDLIAEELDDVLDKRDDECEFKRYDFYEGQILAGPLRLFEEADFVSCGEELLSLRKNSKHKNKSMKVVVEKVEPEGLSIHWQCRAMNTAAKNNNELATQQPPDYVTGDALKRVHMLNVFEPCTLQIGDRNFYTLKDDDIIMLQHDWKKLEKESILREKVSQSSCNVSKLPKTSSDDSKIGKGAESCTSTVIKNDDSSPNDANSILNDMKDSLHITSPSRNDEHESADDNQTGDSDSDKDAFISEASSDDNVIKADKKNAKCIPSKSRSRTTSGNLGSTSQAVTVSANQIAGRGQKKKKKLRKSKKLVSQELGNDIYLPHTLVSELNIVKPGDKVVVETISTHSEATVVWQDGQIEPGIPSRELFPILHLDEQEFFSGDYVIRATAVSGDNTIDPHSYGVVQSVNHFDRVCIVHWYRNYTTQSSESRPIFCGQTEEPVYDLKDHPDFKYRPGSIVIRVANFIQGDNIDPSKFDGSLETISGSGGQVLDNYPSGKILVWWPNDQTSECWPQDLYKIGEYDSDEGELWEDDDEDDDISEASWETESEHSGTELEDPSIIQKIRSWPKENDGDQEDDDIKSKLASNIEKARVSMARLEEIFQGNPSLQSTAVMKQLLDVYKGCKLLDILMDTSFFEEGNFEGLVEKLKDLLKNPSMGHHHALQEQFTRLFSAQSMEESSQEIHSTDLENGQETSADTAKSLGEQIKTLENNLINQASKDMEENLKSNQNMANQTCSRLCSLIKAQLLKSHEEVVRRYGGQSAEFTPEDLEQNPGDDKAELDEIMTEVMETSFASIRENKDLETPSTPNDGNSSRPKLARGVSNYEISAALHGTPEQKKQEHESKVKLNCEDIGEFSMVELAPNEHKFKLAVFQPNDPKNFIKFVRKELQLLRSSLPSGIFVKGFEDRMDLYSVMIKGPEKTPYEDGLFFFDFQLPSDYPKVPPLVHYISYVADKLNPNLYEDGKVCVSLLGTWSGKGTETWTPNSNMLQLLVSIQGLILVPEPYYNEAGYERQKGTQQGIENSRMYNELAILKMTQSLSLIAKNPLHVFKEEILDHLKSKSDGYISRLEAWLSYSENKMKSNVAIEAVDGQGEQLTSSTLYETTIPEFPLLPGSKGFCISLKKALAAFRETMNEV